LKVLLINPQFPDTYWSFRHALPFERKRSAFPPLGLLTVAGLLPATWERRLVDLEIGDLEDADIEWADIVFVTAMLIQSKSLHLVISRCKRAGKKVVVGGPYVTTLKEELAGADHIFLGEVETTLPQFVKDLECGDEKRVYQSPERPALSATPTPDFALADLKSYSAMSIQYSRGCPFQCEFCDIIEIYGRVPRTKSDIQLINELDALYEAGWRGPVFIVDDNFIGNKRNVKRMLPALAEWSRSHNYPFAFMTEASVNLSEDEALLESMRSAGFRRVFLGIETPVEDSLREAQKGQNLRRNLLESIHIIQDHGLEIMAGFIVGFDHDPEDIFDRQINFIRASAIPLAMVNLLSALPDTQLWRRLEREGRLIDEASGNNSDCSLNFIPRMDPDRLIEGYKRVMLTIYKPSEYYARALDCLTKVVQKGPNPRGTSFTQDIATLLRIISKIGIRDRERLEFWMYIFRLLTRHRSEFARGVRLAAMGYHLRKLSDLYCSTAAEKPARKAPPVLSPSLLKQYLQAEE
jgi:radical SAM superfamily enzyme YgiQ (UPF0313 family)